MISNVAGRGVEEVSLYDVRCVVKEAKKCAVISSVVADEDIKGWGFPDTLKQSLPTIHSLILPEIARLEQQLKDTLYLMWESVLSLEDKREMRKAARRILDESHDIAETAKMLHELGK